MIAHMTKTPLIFNMRPSDKLGALITQSMGAETGQICHRHFPDGESYIRLETDVKDRDVIFITDLSQPDCKLIPLIFAAKTAASLGAYRVGLVAPYLPYMRQDRSFQSGESISAHHFAHFLSDAFDWLVTIDPHLHRVKNLADLYQLKPLTLTASPLIAAWIESHIKNPLIIGPDSESHQWASSIANALNVPFIVASKVRRGDQNVEVDMPISVQFKNQTPVIVDDIISTGTTLIETIKALQPFVLKPVICIAVHALLPPDRENEILRNGAAQIITTNTITHKSNAIEVVDLISQAIDKYLKSSKS